MADYAWKNGIFSFENSVGKTDGVSMAKIKALPQAAQDFLLDYGVKQWFASYMAKAGKDTPDSHRLTVAKEAIARLAVGDFKTTSGYDADFWKAVFSKLDVHGKELDALATRAADWDADKRAKVLKDSASIKAAFDLILAEREAAKKAAKRQAALAQAKEEKLDFKTL